MSKYRDILDSAITQAMYGAHLSDVAASLVNNGLPIELLNNAMRLVKWEASR